MTESISTTNPLTFGVRYDEVRGPGPSGDTVLPLRLNRIPTVLERRASVARDAIGHLPNDTCDFTVTMTQHQTLEDVREKITTALSMICQDAAKEERRQAEAAQRRAEQDTAGAESVKAALRKADFPEAGPDDGRLGGTSRQW